MTGVVTCGDINGIGPEVAVKAINKLTGLSLVNYKLLIPRNVYEVVSDSTGIDLRKKQRVEIIDIGEYPLEVGKPTKESGSAAFSALEKAFKLVQSEPESFLVTAPISKYAFRLAGINFPGHTELLASWSATRDFVMMFLSENLKCGLATIHTPLNEVSKLLTSDSLKRTIETILHSLKADFGIGNPKIAVLGLNPHAGENGLIGDEETKTITPVLEQYSSRCFGPFPADAFFARKLYQQFNLFLAMYHDQGLIPFKLMTAGSGVNFTAGLKIVRTSPDHGTAYDIAGEGKADFSSMLEAIDWGYRIATNRRFFYAG